MAYDKVVDSAQLDADLKIVADAIREKSGTTEDLDFPLGMKEVVESIDTSKEEQEKIISITENGTTEVTPDEGKVLSKVTVNTNIESGGGGDYTSEEMIALVEKEITTFVVPNGATRIGNSFFRVCLKLKTVVIPDTVTEIKESAFETCTKLNLTELPDSIVQISDLAFASGGGNKLTKLPSNLQTIGKQAFAYSNEMSITEIPATVKTIGQNAFTQTNLTTITFKGTPTTIGNNIFQNCKNLLIINVPWAEGVFKNAPWGATNATINYNYTGE